MGPAVARVLATAGLVAVTVIRRNRCAPGPIEVADTGLSAAVAAIVPEVVLAILDEFG